MNASTAQSHQPLTQPQPLNLYLYLIIGNEEIASTQRYAMEQTNIHSIIANAFLVLPSACSCQERETFIISCQDIAINILSLNFIPLHKVHTDFNGPGVTQSSRDFTLKTYIVDKFTRAVNVMMSIQANFYHLH